MPIFNFDNFINTTLAANVTSGATTITLASTTGLPSSIPSGQVIVIILADQATRSIFEVVYATAISGATLTVQRHQEGTTALSWLTGDYAYSDVTAGQMGGFRQSSTLPAMQVFVSSGTFTVPTGVYSVKASLFGGGGGGGAAIVSAGAAASGGGCGAYREGFLSVTPGASITVTIGTAGVAGTTSSGNGGVGGTSSVGAISAGGGGGGIESGGGGQGSVGVAGTGSGGTFSPGGQTGGAGTVIGSICFGGFGGSPFSSSGAPGNINGAGSPGAFPGGGGGGGASTGAAATNGGSGGAGIVILEW